MKKNPTLISTLSSFLLVIVLASSCSKGSTEMPGKASAEASAAIMKSATINGIALSNDSLIKLDRLAHPEEYRRIDSILEAEKIEYLNKKKAMQGNIIPRRLMTNVTAVSHSFLFPQPSTPSSLKYSFTWDEIDFAGPMTFQHFITSSLTPKTVSPGIPDFRTPSNGVRAYIILMSVEWYYVGGSGSTFSVAYRTYGNIFEDLNLSQPTLTIQLL